MKIRILAVLTMLAVARMAAAEFEIVTQVKATELSPSNIILPSTTNGMMTYRPCAGECATKVAGRPVKYADFLKQFALIKNGRNSYALVSVDLKTKTVTGINIKG